MCLKARILEYKREITSKSLSREAVAFANHRGGKIMIGVDDDGTIVGVQGQTVEDVANIIRDGCVSAIESAHRDDGLQW